MSLGLKTIITTNSDLQQKDSVIYLINLKLTKIIFVVILI